MVPVPGAVGATDALVLPAILMAYLPAPTERSAFFAMRSAFWTFNFAVQVPSSTVPVHTAAKSWLTWIPFALNWTDTFKLGRCFRAMLTDAAPEGESCAEKG